MSAVIFEEERQFGAIAALGPVMARTSQSKVNG
jgi:hypothetical protein